MTLQKRSSKRSWLGILLAALLLASVTPTAAASDADVPADIERGTTSSADGYSSPSAPGRTTLNLGVESIGLNHPDGQVVMQLPGTRTVTSEHAATYRAKSHRLHVQSIADGAVTTIELIDASAPTEYRFPLSLPPRWSLEPTGDGGFTILDADAEPAGAVAPPWARDADGKVVETYFELQGNTLVQHVDHEGHVYPVFADPSVTLGRNVYVWYWGYEITWWGSVSAAYLAAYFCTVYGALHPALCAVSAAGAVYLQMAFSSVFAGDGCRYVTALRYYGWPNYMERLSGYGCSYRKYEIPG